MNVKIVKGPLFEKKEIEVYQLIQKIIAKQIKEESQ